MISTSTEPNIFRMLFSIKNQKNMMLYIWWTKNPVFSMKYWQGWLLLKTPSWNIDTAVYHWKWHHFSPSFLSQNHWPLSPHFSCTLFCLQLVCKWNNSYFINIEYILCKNNCAKRETTSLIEIFCRIPTTGDPRLVRIHLVQSPK